MLNMKTKKLRMGPSSQNSDSDSVESPENVYCILLHVVEGVNFYGRELRETCDSGRPRSKVVMNASLNGVQFEIEGNMAVATETTTFNSNCIWECDLPGIKRIKTDNRPVKLVFYVQSNVVERKMIGNLLLPLRGLPIICSSNNVKTKIFWHKLSCLSNEYRSHKPEVNAMLIIVKKNLLLTPEFESLFFGNKRSPRSTDLQSPDRSVTASMLQSQANIYVQQLVQLGLLQVGNDARLDCDIIEVILFLKELKHINKFIKTIAGREEMKSLTILLDFVGNITTTEININETDHYVLSEKLGLRFKTSLKSLRLYFQRIFYLPINLYFNGTAIANYRMDFGKLMPEDSYFHDAPKYVRNGLFIFDRLCKMVSARDHKPTVEYTFSIEVVTVNSRPKSISGLSCVSQIVPGNEILSANLLSENNEYMKSLDGNEKVVAWCDHIQTQNKFVLPIANKTPVQIQNDWPIENNEINQRSARSEKRNSSNVKRVLSRLTNNSGYESVNSEDSESGHSSDFQSSKDAALLSDNELQDDDDMKSIDIQSQDSAESHEEDNLLDHEIVEHNDDYEPLNDAQTEISYEPYDDESQSPRPYSADEESQSPRHYSADEESQSPRPSSGDDDGSPTPPLTPCQRFVTRTDNSINTDPVQIVTDEGVLSEKHYNIVKELEEWKSEQMRLFNEELKRKEENYLEALKVGQSQQFEDQLNEIQKTLIEKDRNQQHEEHLKSEKRCKALEEKLLDLQRIIAEATSDKAREQAEALELAKRELRHSYQLKFEELETYITRLKVEMEKELHSLEARNREARHENTHLSHEKLKLMERNNDLEMQLNEIRQHKIGNNDQLGRVMDELRALQQKYTELEKARDFYKSQWRRSVKRLHKYKIEMIDKQEHNLHDLHDLQVKNESDVQFDIRRMIAGDCGQQDPTEQIKVKKHIIKDLQMPCECCHQNARLADDTSTISSCDYMNDSLTESFDSYN